jgi:hypothetical protein
MTLKIYDAYAFNNLNNNKIENNIKVYYYIIINMSSNQSPSQQPSLLYSKMLITRKVPLSIINVGSNTHKTITKAVVRQLEGKCTVEGFIRPDSVVVQDYSSGELQGANVMFDVVIECDVCCPVEGMEINCVAKNITKAGIRAEIDETPTPVVIFLARDHHSSAYFSNVKVNEKISVRVIGQSFELNDKYVSIIAELIEPEKKKPKLKIIGK